MAKFSMSNAEIEDLVKEVKTSLDPLLKAERERLEKGEHTSSGTSESGSSMSKEESSMSKGSSSYSGSSMSKEESSMSKGSVSPAERSRSPEASSSTSSDVYKASVEPAERSASPSASPGFRKAGVEPAERAQHPTPGKPAGASDSPERRGAIAKAGPPFDEGSPSGSSSGSPSSVSGPSASGSPSASVSGPSASDGSASVDGPPVEAAPPAGPEGAPPDGEAAPVAGPSFEELVSLYASLPPEDFEAHAAAIQQASAMRQGAGPGPEGVPPPGPEGAPAPSPSPAFKSERVEELEARLAKTEADLQAVAETFEKVLTIPQRKAVTGIQYFKTDLMRKSEAAPRGERKAFQELTKAELNKHLLAATGPDSKLTKAERDLINNFYLGTVSVADLEPIYNKS